MKRNYDVHPTSLKDEDLGKAFDYCQHMLDVMLTQMEKSEYAAEKKSICELKEKLLGTKKGNIPQHRSIANEAVKYADPRYERTPHS